MSANSKYTFKKIVVVSVWILLTAGTVVLLVAAITKKNNAEIAGVEIKISGIENNYFIDKKDILSVLEKFNGKKLTKSTMNSLDLTGMEKRLEKDQWIKSAEIFFDNNNVLLVKISEREPIARIFTISGSSFYIDSSLTRLPLSNKFSARLPVFTSFPYDARVLAKQDSMLLNEVKILSEYINEHPFWMAQIDQIDITGSGTFELIPKLGTQVIRFGNTSNCREKFNKLLAFYKQVERTIGWSKYCVLDIQFKNQVIAVNRDAAEIKSDSLRSVQMMKNIIAEEQKNSNDSSKIQLTPQSDNDNDKINDSPVLEKVPQAEKSQITERKESTVASIPVHAKPFLKKQTLKKSKPVIRHPSSNEKPARTPDKKTKVKRVVQQEVEKSKVPKAVMKTKTDY